MLCPCVFAAISYLRIPYILERHCGVRPVGSTMNENLGSSKK